MTFNFEKLERKRKVGRRIQRGQGYFEIGAEEIGCDDDFDWTGLAQSRAQFLLKVSGVSVF